MVAGEITTKGIPGVLDYADIARDVIRDVGYTRAKYGFDAETCAVLSSSSASPRTSPWAWTPAARATRA